MTPDDNSYGKFYLKISNFYNNPLKQHQQFPDHILQFSLKKYLLLAESKHLLIKLVYTPQKILSDFMNWNKPCVQLPTMRLLGL